MVDFALVDSLTEGDNAMRGLLEENEILNSSTIIGGWKKTEIDLTAIHEILGEVGYKDDEGIANELSFQMWTNEMQEFLNAKKHGDTAFRAKDFATAIDCYSQFVDAGAMISPTVLARRCLCYLMSEMPQEALGDAMQAQVISPEWATAYYLQAAALFNLGMDKDAHEILLIRCMEGEEGREAAQRAG